jgi:multidrug efflux system membrane fusion protein
MKEQKMKKIILSVVLSVFALIVLFCQRGDQKNEKDQAVPVRLEAIRQLRLAQPIHTSGRLASSSEIKLSFKIGGILDRISVHEGQKVQKGQVLASLKLDEIDGQVTQARAGFEKAQRDFKRIQNLYADSVTTLEQLQNSESGLQVAKSNLEIAEFNLNHAVITAPSDGCILKQLAEAGELTGSGQPILFFGSRSGRWVVKTGVTDQDLIHLSLGDSASVKFDAYPGRTFSAVVQEIAAGPDPQNGLYEIKVALDPVPESLFSGFIAGVDIYPSLKEMVSVIPFEALVSVSSLKGYVYRIDKDSLAVKIPVRIAYFLGDDAVIQKGLEGIDAVITEGAAYLNGNKKVIIVDSR